MVASVPDFRHEVMHKILFVRTGSGFPARAGAIVSAAVNRTGVPEPPFRRAPLPIRHPQQAAPGIGSGDPAQRALCAFPGILALAGGDEVVRLKRDLMARAVSTPAPLTSARTLSPLLPASPGCADAEDRLFHICRI